MTTTSGLGFCCSCVCFCISEVAALINYWGKRKSFNSRTAVSCFSVIPVWRYSIYFCLIKETVTVGINLINSVSKSVDSSCGGGAIHPRLWVTQHTPDSASLVQPRRCRTPTTLPRPTTNPLHLQPAFRCQVGLTEPGFKEGWGR